MTETKFCSSSYVCFDSEALPLLCFPRCAVNVTVMSLYFPWLSPCWIAICHPLYPCRSLRPVWLQLVSWWPQNWQKVTQLVQIRSVRQQSMTFSHQTCGWVFKKKSKFTKGSILRCPKVWNIQINHSKIVLFCIFLIEHFFHDKWNNLSETLWKKE